MSQGGPLCKSAEESIEKDYEKFGDFFVAREKPAICTDLEVNTQVEQAKKNAVNYAAEDASFNVTQDEARNTLEEDESLVVNDAIQLLLHQIRKDRSVLSQVKKH